MATLRLDPRVDALIFKAANSPEDARTVLRIAAEYLLADKPLSWALAQYLAAALTAGADAREDKVSEGAPGKAIAHALHLTGTGRRASVDRLAIGHAVDELLRQGRSQEAAIGIVVNQHDSDESTVKRAWKAYLHARDEHNAIE